MFNNVCHDLRCGMRILRKSPGLALITALILALGIGLASTSFSILNGLLLRPLPYAASEDLVLIWESDVGRRQNIGTSSAAAFDYWRKETRSFEHLAAVRNHSASLTAVDTPESPLVRLVTASYFPLLGVEPMLGRTFRAEEDIPGGPRVVILSHSVWRRHYGGDSSVLGRTVELDYEPYEVIGVMPAEYRSPIQRDPPQLWLPLALTESNLDHHRRYLVYGRLAEKVSLQRARGEMEQVTAGLRARYPEPHGSRESSVESLQEVLVSPIRRTLWMIFGAAAFVLLIACCNVANLLMARGMTRFREMAIRSAVGASRWALVRQMMVENVLLAVLGSFGGLMLAFWGIRASIALIPQVSTLPRLENVEIDATILLFALILALLIGILLGLIPALAFLLRHDLGPGLRAASGRTTAGRHRHRFRSLLLVVEVGFSLVLLIGAGLMIQTFYHHQREDPGFDPERLLTMRTGLRAPEYAASEKRIAFFRQAVGNLEKLPGVQAVGAVSRVPPRRPLGYVPFEIRADSPQPAGDEPQTLVRSMTPGYPAAMSIPLLHGRFFNEHDDAAGEPVAIASQSLVERYLASRDPIGQILTLKDGRGVRHRIVGVVGDVRSLGNPPDPVPILYFPHAQKPDFVMTFAVRTAVEPMSLGQEVRRTVGELDRLMPSYSLKSMATRLDEADWQSRFSMLLLMIFAVAALLLAATGIYAVTSFLIAERTQEFGIRIVFGASSGEVLRAALRNGMMLTALGIVGGVLAALTLTRLLESQLYGVAKNDPTTYLGLTFVIALVSLLASGIATLRNVHLDPIVALRHE